MADLTEATTSRVVSAAEALRTRDCLTPGCMGEARIGEFCDDCHQSKPARLRRAVSQRAVMERERLRFEAREAARRTDDVAVRRNWRQRIVDGRMRVTVQLGRMLEQAEKRGDDRLVAGLRRAVDAVADELVRREAAS